MPTCPACGSAAWTATYRAQVERIWSVSGQAPQPHCDYEDEDFGEWDTPSCSSCGAAASGLLGNAVLDALLR